MRTVLPYVFIGLLLVLALGWVLYTSLQESENGGTAGDIPIESRFENKIVYTTNLSVDAEPLKKHCEAQTGVFNECGSICKPDAEVCADVCAYTCEL